MTRTVCILTAGVGSRLQERTKYFNKALLRVGNQAVISHQIDLFGSDTEFIIALGYKGDIVRQYLQIAHPLTKFTYVDVDHYTLSVQDINDKDPAGPGYALLKCKEHLQKRFYFLSCDTLVDGYLLDKDDRNWVAYDILQEGQRRDDYCTIETYDEQVIEIFDKKDIGDSEKAFIGFAHIYDYVSFWDRFSNEVVAGEIQATTSIFNLKQLWAYQMTWFDTGDERGLQKARKAYKGIQNLDKLDEELYVRPFSNGSRIIKYFHSAKIAQNRILRCQLLNKHSQAFPTIMQSSQNFYSYPFIEGKDMFAIDRPDDHMLPLLAFTNESLWKRPIKFEHGHEQQVFEDVCRDFYYHKTVTRLHQFYEKQGDFGQVLVTDNKRLHINGKPVRKLKEAFSLLDWRSLFEGTPSGIHGDFNFSNIILNEKANRFTFIDWRQDFGGLIEYGDRYYDFAKMYACLLMPHTSVKDGQYGIVVQDDDSHIDVKLFIDVPHSIAQCRAIFEKWLTDNDYDVRKVQILTALIMLNMSPLHEEPLDQWLYFYARSYLEEHAQS